MLRDKNGINIESHERRSRKKFYEGVQETTARHDRLLSRAFDNATTTIKNRKPETLANQAKHKTDKNEGLKRIDELEPLLENQIQIEIDRFVESFRKHGIKDTMKAFESDLKAFKDLSDEHMKLQVYKQSPKEISYYDRFMHELGRLCPKFVADEHFPLTTLAYFTRSIIPLDSEDISAEELKQLQTRLEQEGLFKNENFKNYYLKYFPDHIADLKDIKDIKFALKLNPASFNLLNPTTGIRGDFKQNSKVLYEVVSAEPGILKYLTEEEFEILARDYTTKVGRLIAACPEILEKLPQNFFKRYPAKLIFTSVKKHEVRNKIVPYYSKFSELEPYFSSVKMVPKPQKVEEVPAQTSFLDPLDF